MEFGKRPFLDPNAGASAVTQETCVRCFGIGRVRERGNRLRCTACGGTGRITVKPEGKAAPEDAASLKPAQDPAA
jgi:hypothetical protein